MSRALLCLCVLALVSARCAAVSPCAVLNAQDRCMRDVNAVIPSGKELIREYVTFHEYFADEHAEFWAFVRRLRDTYNCSAAAS